MPRKKRTEEPMENFPRDFKGIWIPRELWLDRLLSCLERQLIAEIHSLDCGEDHCYASNDHFEKTVQLCL